MLTPSRLTWGSRRTLTNCSNLLALKRSQTFSTKRPSRLPLTVRGFPRLATQSEQFRSGEPIRHLAFLT